MDKRKEEYANEFSQYYGREVEKSGISTNQSRPKQIESLRIIIQSGLKHSITLQEKILFEAYEVKHSLIAMRNSFFGSIILFAITIVLCFTVYSSYAIFSFLLALGLLLYGFSLFIGISKIFLD